MLALLLLVFITINCPLGTLNAAEVRADDNAPPGMIFIPAGELLKGNDEGPAEERPKHRVLVDAFWLDRSPVTVGSFEKFVNKTDHKTTAETYGDSAVIQIGTGLWRLEKGASWQYPMGREKFVADATHPVTHVSWHDAVSYCGFHGKRLPTESEWEHAARNGRNSEGMYTFGDSYLREGEFLANIWTGLFPVLNTEKDGYLYTSPVGKFGINDIGLTDMAGNVWEWVDDWFLPYGRGSVTYQSTERSEKVQKGGSFLCDPNFCHGFRITARSHSTPDSSFMHVGFRCAQDRVEELQ